MKKIFLSALIFFGLMLSFQPNAHAGYPMYLEGNPDWVITYAHTGVAWYLQKSSLNVELYNPPFYIISVRVQNVCYDDLPSIGYGKLETMRFYYDWNKREMYRQGDDGGWHYLTPVGPEQATAIYMPTGEKAFYLAYRMKFYGSGEKVWYDNLRNKYTYPKFDDEFYRR